MTNWHRDNRVCRILLIFTLCLCVIGLAGCGNDSSEDQTSVELPAVTNMAGTVTSAEVSESIKAAGLSNVEVFSDWVQDFAGCAGSDAGLVDAWTDPSSIDPDLAKCMDGWESHYDYSDADCRMTAFLLLDGLISANRTDSSYDGTYLMFDVDAIQNVPRYEAIKRNLDLFTTLFGDRTPEEGEEPKDVIGRVWNDYGYTFSNDKASLLSIAVYDPDFDQVFVGHTGVLVDEGENLLFIEKLAFEQPYQAIRAENMEDLLAIIADRESYYESEEDGAFVYLNGEYLGNLNEYKK